MTIIWCMVPEILSVTDRIFCHFGPFFLHFFNPLTTQKIKILKIKKKTPRDIIILHMCTKNHDLMLYCSWGMVRDGCNYFFSFWTFFLPFYPPPPTPLPPPPSLKFQKNEINAWRCHHFTQVYQKLWSYGTLFLRYCVWQM